VEADPATRDLRTNYHFLTSAVAPRPIAWVTTKDPATGVVNAAPFSFFQAVCADPMLVSLAIIDRAPGVPKDTARNILASKEFVVNVVPRDLLDPMVASSADYPPTVSEVQELGLRTVPSRKVAPPRLADSPVHFECRLHKVVEVGRSQTVKLLLGEVLHLAADDAALDARGNVDPAKVRFLARMGGQEYVDTSAFFAKPRPPPGDPAKRA
jgi:flavin reductase (DIM6/NTAB) family NADH-FMN oxidoreductase RutF